MSKELIRKIIFIDVIFVWHIGIVNSMYFTVVIYAKAELTNLAMVVMKFLRIITTQNNTQKRKILKTKKDFYKMIR